MNPSRCSHLSSSLKVLYTWRGFKPPISISNRQLRWWGISVSRLSRNSVGYSWTENAAHIANLSQLESLCNFEGNWTAIDDPEAQWLNNSAILVGGKQRSYG